MGPSASGTFDRTLSVSGRIRLELNNTSGERLHYRQRRRQSPHSWHSPRLRHGLDSPDKRMSALLANPPIEQHGATIRIGEKMRRLRNVSVSYMIEVPHETEITSRVLSGGQDIQNVARSGESGSCFRLDSCEPHRPTDAALHAKRTIRADNIGDDIRANSASGTVTVSNIKGDIRISALSGSTQITKPGGGARCLHRSGSVDVEGATSDVKAHAASGRVNVQGNPGASSYWESQDGFGKACS